MTQSQPPGMPEEPKDVARFQRFACGGYIYGNVSSSAVSGYIDALRTALAASQAEAQRNRDAAETWAKAHNVQIERAEKAESALAAEQARCRELEADARRWRGLINCRRIRVMGRAGFNGDQKGYRHIGIEFWTHHQCATEGDAKEALIEFVEAAIDAATAREGAEDGQ